MPSTMPSTHALDPSAALGAPAHVTVLFPLAPAVRTSGDLPVAGTATEVLLLARREPGGRWER